MNIDSHVVVAAQGPDSSEYADPEFHRMTFYPGFGRHAPLNIDGGGESFACSVKDTEEGVAFRMDLYSVVASDGLADQSLMSLQGRPERYR
jgi:hypothetical protein